MILSWNSNNFRQKYTFLTEYIFTSKFQIIFKICSLLAKSLLLIFLHLTTSHFFFSRIFHNFLKQSIFKFRMITRRIVSFLTCLSLLSLTINAQYQVNSQNQNPYQQQQYGQQTQNQQQNRNQNTNTNTNTGYGVSY